MSGSSVKSKPSQLARGDVFQFAGRYWVILDVDELIIYQNEKRYKRNVWVCLGDSEGDIHDFMVDQFFSVIQSDNVRYVGRAGKVAERYDSWLQNIRQEPNTYPVFKTEASAPNRLPA